MNICFVPKLVFMILAMVRLHSAIGDILQHKKEYLKNPWNWCKVSELVQSSPGIAGGST